ncbi:MAG TPA: hypothetical protein DFK19_16510 [Ochrobactrum sp.]|nr:hypothetical protein [Ochrobactrum sp.]
MFGKEIIASSVVAKSVGFIAKTLRMVSVKSVGIACTCGVAGATADMDGIRPAIVIDGRSATPVNRSRHSKRAINSKFKGYIFVAG